LLQAAYSNYQIGAFENFHVLVEDMLIVLRPGSKVFFQYELRFVNRLKSQLLISHLFFLPIKEMPSDREKEAKNQAAFWEISPLYLDDFINFYFNAGALAAPDRGVPWFHTLPRFLGIFEWPPRLRRRVCEGPLLAALFGSGAVSDLSQQVARMSAAICGDRRPKVPDVAGQGWRRLRIRSRGVMFPRQ
jgi:hypothetical protein